MKSYLTIWFSTEGKQPMDIIDRLMGMGFRPVKGNYDFVYDWSKKATIDEAINLTNKVYSSLKGCHVHFRVETD
ncbi:MAG: hypothetical protein V1911_00880 [Candidatus Micrarchaeota archaeon]